MKTTFLRKQLQGRRTLVACDIHGHTGLFKKLLSDAGFSEDDLLIIIGDIVEKGPDSLGTLRYVKELTGRGNTIPLMGNVDACRVQMIDELSESTAADFLACLKQIRSWTGCMWDEMTDELGLPRSETEADLLSARDKVIDHFKPELDFLSSLPTALETGNFVFVHGGLRDTDIKANETRQSAELLKYDNFYALAPEFDKYIVVGHYPVTLYSDKISDCTPRVDRGRKIIALDGGCGIKNYGQLNLMITDGTPENISFLSADDLPKVKALDSQTGSDDHINIRWIDRGIETLEKFDGYRKIRHRSTGHVCLIPDAYVRDDEHAADYSDYLLPVTAGETLALVDETPLGYIVKKNGVTGLYKGSIANET